jgi:hypothetical protein
VNICFHGYTYALSAHRRLPVVLYHMIPASSAIPQPSTPLIICQQSIHSTIL